MKTWKRLWQNASRKSKDEYKNFAGSSFYCYGIEMICAIKGSANLQPHDCMLAEKIFEENILIRLCFVDDLYVMLWTFCFLTILK